LRPYPRGAGALTLDALVAGVLILYPRYLDPVSGLPCPPEVLVGAWRARRRSTACAGSAPCAACRDESWQRCEGQPDHASLASDA
jgi:capsular polysaccharide export protein